MVLFCMDKLRGKIHWGICGGNWKMWQFGNIPVNCHISGDFEI